MSTSGVVKTFSAKNGYGFIVSEEVPGDIYFQARDLPGSFQRLDTRTFKLEGVAVAFECQTTEDGKPQAKQVKLVSGATEGGGALLFGQVKRYNATKGFGFIECDQVEGDVYFQTRAVPQPFQALDLTGAAVAFESHEVPDGKVQGRNVQVLAVPSGGGGGPMQGMGQGMGGQGKGRGGPQPQPQPMMMLMQPQPAVTGMTSGGATIRTGKGGTVRLMTGSSSPQQRQMSMASPQPMMMMMSAGKGQRFAPGGGTGMVLVGGSGGGIQMAGTRSKLPKDGSSETGVVKSFQQAKGWGFITTSRIPMDVYFKSDMVFEPGHQVTFTLRWKPDGRPQGQDVQPAVVVEDGTAVAGVVKSFSDKNGYGFISTDSMSQDLYFKRADLPADLQAATSEDLTGVSVQCLVSLQRDGKPQAKDIAFVDGPPQGNKRKTFTGPANNGEYEEFDGPAAKRRTCGQPV